MMLSASALSKQRRSCALQRSTNADGELVFLSFSAVTSRAISTAAECGTTSL
jgi:hypothetical protein